MNGSDLHRETVPEFSENTPTAMHVRQSEARLRAGIEAVSDIIWTNDAQGMMVGPQAGWERFTGQDRESYEGKGWCRALHPDDALPTVNAWNEAVAAKKQFAFQHRVRRRDGGWRLCSVRAAPVFDARGELIEWVGVHSDITDLKRAESLHEGQRRILEMIAVDAPLPDVLAAVCRLIEEQEPDVLCSLLLPDQPHRQGPLAAGATLPASFLVQLKGLRI